MSGDARIKDALESVTEFVRLKEALELIDKLRLKFNEEKAMDVLLGNYEAAGVAREYERLCEKELKKNRSFFNG